MMTTLRALVVAVLLAPVSGCCTLAALWCGPDRSEWVAQSFRTPVEALATFREAARRDDVAVIGTCFSEGFQERNGLHGSVDIAIVWDRLKREVGGLHLLGRAEVAPFATLPDGRQRTTLCVAGNSIEITLVRQQFWLLRVGDAQRSRNVRSIASLITLPAPGAREDLEVRLTPAARGTATIPDCSTEDVHEVTVAREWKIDDVREPRRDSH